MDVAKMKFWEKRVWTESDAITMVSDRDKQTVSTAVDPQKISVVANGVDLVDFAFRPKKNFDKNKLTFLYVGNLARMENKDAVEHLIIDFWTTIIKRYPAADLRIVGRNIPKTFEKLQSSAIHFLSSVDVIPDELYRADIMLTPIRVGGGTKYKILEALSAGLPVITSAQGVVGMHVTGGKELLIADTIQDVLVSIEMLTNASQRLKL